MNPKPNTICDPFPVVVEWLTSVVGIHKGKAGRLPLFVRTLERLDYKD